MTERAKGFIVHLEDDLRIGDGDVGADRILDAIRCIKGVAKVEAVIGNVDDTLNRERIRRELLTQLRDLLHPQPWGLP